MSQYAQLYSTLVTIAAPFSLLGSSAMLYVISRSRAKLSTTLNRLLVGLCVGDIIFSFPMLFSKAILRYEERVFNDVAYTAVMPSNQAACSTQGFFVSLGMVLGPLNNCALCVYYVCVVKLNMSVTKIKKKVEPFLHAIPWVTAITLSSTALATKSINPAYSMCRVAEYRPNDCESDDCARRNDRVRKLFLIQSASLLIAFIAIIVMMGVIFLKVWRQERRMKNAGYRSSNAAKARRNEANMISGNRNQAHSCSNGLSLRQNVTNSRKVLNQALAYAGAYFATWFFVVFLMLSEIITQKSMAEVMSVIAAICIPLQGFFNFLVFIYPRVTLQLRGNDDMNVLQALCAAIRRTPIPPRNRRNRGVGNAAAAGTGATGRGVNDAIGTRNISGLTGGGNGGTSGNTTATTYGTRNISGSRGAGGARNAGTERKSVILGDGWILAENDNKEEQSMHNVSGGTAESLARLSQNTVSTPNASFNSIGKVGGGESQIEEEFGQEEMSEIEERMTITDEEVGMLDTSVGSNEARG